LHQEFADIIAGVDVDGKKPERKKKEVDRFDLEVLSLVPKATRETVFEDGTGDTLRDVNALAKNVRAHDGDDAIIKKLHQLLYGRPGKAHETKKNILRFSGLPAKSKKEGKEKFHSKLTTWRQNDIRAVAKMFLLESGGSKEELIAELVEFLSAPKAPKVLPAKKPKKKKTITKKKPLAKKKPSKKSASESEAESSAAESESAAESSGAEKEKTTRGRKRKASPSPKRGGKKKASASPKGKKKAASTSRSRSRSRSPARTPTKKSTPKKGGAKPKASASPKRASRSRSRSPARTPTKKSTPKKAASPAKKKATPKKGGAKKPAAKKRKTTK